jgi:hypothetical protein
MYNNGKLKLANGGIDVDTDTLKVSLHTSTYAINIDTHVFFSDLTNEVVGTGYTAGGATLASVVGTVNTTNDRAEFDAADTSWTTATITARYAVIYKSTGVAGTSPLIGLIDFTTDQTSTAGTFTIVWAANGFLNLT